MPSLDIRPLEEHLNFGVRISGVTHDALKDEAIRQQIRDSFEAEGMIVFEDIEPSSRMQIELSNVFGPLKQHPVKSVKRVDDDLMPGVIEINYEPGDEHGVVEIDGEQFASWLPWHFDHCYNNELNRAGILRAVEIAPTGGRTGFADGIELYRLLDPDLRKRIEDKNVLYRLSLYYSENRFGLPANFREVQVHAAAAPAMKAAEGAPRAVHPAVWERSDGRKVLHVSNYMAEGIEGEENEEGDELLEAVCQEINSKAPQVSYHHQWRPTDMLIWDNWRMLHSVPGIDPDYRRRMHRTTIKGDYGLGYFENEGTGRKILEMTV